MSEELLKHLLKLKISLVRKVFEGLPQSVQKPVNEVETRMMRVLYHVSKQYLLNPPIDENTKTGGLKVIDVE